jgi:hypothetical protein
VSENKFLRKIFGTKRDTRLGEIMQWELHNLYCSPKKIVMIHSRRRRWIEHVAGMVEKRNAYRVLVAKTEGKRYQEITGEWGNYINVGFRE